jgi:hypothetical protein
MTAFTICECDHNDGFHREGPCAAATQLYPFRIGCTCKGMKPKRAPVGPHDGGDVSLCGAPGPMGAVGPTMRTQDVLAGLGLAVDAILDQLRQARLREPTQQEGEIWEGATHVTGETFPRGQCWVPNGGWTGRRCRSCKRWVWGGPNACTECVKIGDMTGKLARIGALLAIWQEGDEPEGAPSSRRVLQSIIAVLRGEG